MASIADLDTNMGSSEPGLLGVCMSYSLLLSLVVVVPIVVMHVPCANYMSAPWFWMALLAMPVSAVLWALGRTMQVQATRVLPIILLAMGVWGLASSIGRAINQYHLVQAIGLPRVHGSVAEYTQATLDGHTLVVGIHNGYGLRLHADGHVDILSPAMELGVDYSNNPTTRHWQFDALGHLCVEGEEPLAVDAHDGRLSTLVSGQEMARIIAVDDDNSLMIF